MIRTDPSCLLNKFLFYYLHSEFGRANVTSQMKGTAITRITLQQVKKTAVPTPLLPDQEIIVDIFEKLYSTKEQLLKTMDDLSKQNSLLLNHLIG
jgi:type I restriction enzyme, S subunit